MSLRREVRLRKEFLQRKQQTSEITIRNEKKRKIKSSLETGIHILNIYNNHHLLNLMAINREGDTNGDSS